MSHARYRRTTLYTLFCAGVLIGLGVSRLRWLEASYVLLIWFVCLALLRRQHSLIFLLYLLAGIALGVWRGAIVMQRVDAMRSLAGRQVVIRGYVSTDGVYGDKSQMEFDLSRMTVVEPDVQPLAGKMIVKGFGENMIYRGDRVAVRGKLYLSWGSRQTGISFATITVLERSTSKLDQVRRRFEAGTLSVLPEPLGSFGLGLLIGQRSNLPKDLSDTLSTAGLTHIVAVSGYNLTIILRAMRRLFAKRSKYQATMLSLLCMLLFVLCTGFSASIVRASLVSGLSLWAWYYGRSFKPLFLILLVASLTAIVNPFYVWSDIGWYLSFLAFFGVMVIGPEVQKRVSRGREGGLLSSIIIETSAAQIMTVPIVMYIFGRFSLIALLSNMLVVPLVSLAMLLSLIAGLSGVLLPALAGWFTWPARYLLTYMIDIVRLMGSLSWASFELPLGLVWTLLAYASLIIGIVILTRKNRGKYGTITSDNS